MFDAHCHLHLKAFDADRPEVLREARDAGVRGFLSCAVDDGDWNAAVALSRREGDVFAGIGIHPLALTRWPAEDDGEKLLRMADFIRANREDVSMVGECGLDARIADRVPLERQVRTLEGQLKVAQGFGLPVAIHCVRAMDALEATLRRLQGLKGILHAFGGSLEQARTFMGLGDFAFSFGGALTLPSRKRQRLVQGLPSSRILAETDAPDGPPFFPPALSGREGDGGPVRIHPSSVSDAVAAIASIRGEDAGAWRSRTESNAMRLVSGESFEASECNNDIQGAKP